MYWRSKYIEPLLLHSKSDFIKVLIGIRRAGKSVILKQIYNKLLVDVKSENTLFLNMELLEYIELRNYLKMYEYISNHFTNVEGKLYLFIDEIQFIYHFEELLNSLRVKFDISIYITGSNSDLLSSEISSLLSGRYVEYSIYPFSFKEYCEYKIELESNSNIDEMFSDYIVWGGFPQIIAIDFKLKKEALNSIVRSVVNKDIINRYNVKDISLLEYLVSYLINNSSKEFSIKSIVNYLLSQGIRVGNDTLYKYLGYIQSAFILSSCRVFDIKGKRLLQRNEKKYVIDLGLCNVVKYNDTINFSTALETLVYNHLLSEGYVVYTGKNKEFEVDFIAIKDGKKLYIQVCYLLGSEQVIEREFRALANITDSNQRYVLSMDKEDFSKNGIIHMNIINYLMKEKNK